MIGAMDLRQLATYTAHKSPALSVYLDADVAKMLRDQIRLDLRAMLDKAEQEGATKQDVERIERYVNHEYDWQGRGLIIFSCLADGLWQPYSLSIPVRSQVFVGDKLYLRPINDIEERYSPYAVAVVQQEGARLFLVDMGGIVKEEEVRGQPVKHQKQGGQSAEHFQRHENLVALHNMCATGEALGRFCATHHCRYIVLGGTEGNSAKFREQLPHAMQQIVAGTITPDFNAPGTEIVRQSAAVLDELETQRQHRLVQDMITARAKGTNAVTGLPDTLTALQEKRVWALLVEEGFQAPGQFCSMCNYVGPMSPEPCLRCGQTPDKQVADVVERAQHDAILQGAMVEVIPAEPALTEAGHIGAILRY